jgi:tryptophan synthase alpha chain
MNTEHHIKLMSHLVAEYPTKKASLTAAKAMIKGGAEILEIQLPFSDPSADGPAIQGACSTVLSHDYSTDEGLNFIAEIHKEFPQTTLYIMSYGSLIYTPGIENFCAKAARAGVTGMIIPDLPFDCDEGLTAACKKNGMENIPVAAPSMTPERIAVLVDRKFKYIYAALRAGITGSKTVIDDKTFEFIKSISNGGAKILAGFGIQNGKQAAELAPSVYAVVAGSVFVNIITQKADNLEKLTVAVKGKATELSEGY